MRKNFGYFSVVFALISTLLLSSVTAMASNSQYYNAVLESNRNARDVQLDPALYLDMDDPEMQTLSDQIVKGISDDYSKVKAIHDWVCANIYYDLDGLGYATIAVESDKEAAEIANMSVYKLLMTYRRGKCSYYSSIFSTLVRAQGIPCMTVSGYAENKEVPSQSSGGYLVNYNEQKIYVRGDKWTESNYNRGANHDWNEAYVNGRWIIVDTTWDSGNQYQNGNYISASVRQSYFDISEELFSKDHRITEYGKGESRVPASQQVFQDVAKTDYYYSAVQWAFNKKIAAGTSSVTFSPNERCTQAQIIVFLYRSVNSPSVQDINPYTNSMVNPTQYYYDALLWAYQKGVVADKDLAPNDNCTRAEVVTYLWRLAGSPATAYDGRFSDVSDDAGYAQAVAWAVKENITAGVGNGLFAPNKVCTRGQIVTFLYRAYNK